MPDELKTGAVVMMDALGFKGIWKQHPEILTKLRALPKFANDIRTGVVDVLQVEAIGEIKRTIEIKFLSDTIVMAVTAELADGGPCPEYVPLSFVTTACASLLGAAALRSPALAYRGCATAGKFAMDGNFILGPAIDEAADLMNRAEAAIVWLTPQAAEVAESQPKPSYPLMPYSVPLKGGGTFNTVAVSPFATSRHMPQIREALLESFNNPNFDVQLKRQNTRLFLDAAQVQRVAYDAWRRDQPKSAEPIPEKNNP